MDLLTSLDPTAVCITLLIAAFTLLWLYVSMSGARREQPNLSALYEQTTLRSGAAGQSRSPRAAVKGKGKGKQVEGSPRPSVQKSTTSEMAAVGSQKAALPTQQASQTVKVSSDTPAPKPAGNKGKKKRQSAQAPENEGTPKPQLEEGNEGEWQTQLSRQQLKALRKKQKKEREKEKAEREEASKSSSSDTDNKQVSTATPSTSDDNGGDRKKKGQKKEREAEEPSKSKEDTEERATKSSDNGSRGKGSSNRQKASEKSQADSVAKSSHKSWVSTVNQQPLDKEEEKALSSELTGSGAAESVGVSNVEEALKEAARSTSNSPEADNQSAETEAPFTEVKSKSHRKQKATNESSIPQDQPSLDTEEHDEEWVVIEGESLT